MAAVSNSRSSDPPGSKISGNPLQMSQPGRSFSQRMSEERDGKDGEIKLEGKRDATWHCHRELYRTLGPATLHSPHHFILCMRRFSALCCLNFQSWTFQHSPGLRDGPRFLATGGAVSPHSGVLFPACWPITKNRFFCSLSVGLAEALRFPIMAVGMFQGISGLQKCPRHRASRRPD